MKYKVFAPEDVEPGSPHQHIRDSMEEVYPQQQVVIQNPQPVEIYMDNSRSPVVTSAFFPNLNESQQKAQQSP